MAAPETQQTGTTSRTRRWLLWLGAATILFVGIITLLPELIGYGIREALLRGRSEQVELLDVDFNPFTGRFRIRQLQAALEDDTMLGIEDAELDIAWGPLFRKQILVQRVYLSGSTVTVERLEEGDLRTAGLIVAKAKQEAEQAPEPTAGRPWHFGAEAVQLQDLELRYRDPKLTLTLAVDEASLTPLKSWTPDEAARLALRGRINDSPLALELELRPFGEVLQLQGRTRLEQFDIAPFAVFAGDTLQELAGRVSLDSDLVFRLESSGDMHITQEGALSLEDHRARRADFELQEPALRWKGRTDLALREDGTLNLNLKGRLGSDAVEARLPEADWALSYEQADLELDLGLITGEQDTRIRWDGGLSMTGVVAGREDQELREAALQWQGQTQTTLKQDGTLELLMKGQVNSESFQARLAAEGWQLGYDQLTVDVDLALATAEAGVQVQWEGGLKGDGLSIEHLGQAVQVLSAEQFELTGARLPDLDHFQGERLLISELLVSRLASKPEAALVELAELGVTDLAWSKEGGTRIQGIALRDLAAELSRDAEGGWPLLDPLLAAVAAPADSPETEAAPSPAPKPSEPAPLQIGEVAVTGESRLRFEDQTVKPAFETTLNLSQLTVKQLDIQQPDAPSPFVLKGKTEKYSTVDVAGELYPFQTEPTLNLKGDLKSVSLTALSPYARRVLGYSLTSGQLDAAIDLKLDQGQMQGENKLLLRNLTVKPYDADKMEALNQQVRVPLDTALSMLRDADNHIKLNLPLSGSIDDPKFSIGDVINTALGKAMKKAAVSYLSYAIQPYGTILGAVKLAGEAVTALRLEPVPFGTGSAQWPADQSKYLEKIAGILKDRPGLGLRVCGIATEADRQALLQAAIEGQQAQREQEKTKTKEAPPPPQIPDSALEGLAGNRAEALKDHLVEQYGIAADRLYLCLPDIDGELDAKPRVDLLI
jgi:hypothetical protein